MSRNRISVAIKRFRPGPSRLAATAAMVAAGLGALTLTAPAAHAGNDPFPQSRTVGPCTVTAKTPKAVGESPSGHTLVEYPVSVSCKAGGLKVKMEQRLMEWDDLGYDDGQRPGYTKIPGTPLDFRQAGSATRSDIYRLLKSEWWEGPVEEVYHKVRFQLVSDNGITSGDWVYVQSPTNSIKP